jgi:hypothetical protein
MTVFQRLLKYPHAAVFDKGSHAEPVLQVRGDSGLTWSVADEALTIVSGADTFTYDLASLTLGQLSAALTQDGLQVGALSPAFAGLSATVLVEGSGDQAQSNGDRLQAFTNLLWSLYGAYAKESREAGRQVREALKQMVITQAEGEWLDLWGRLYGVGRETDEADPDYAPRIPREAFRIRVNALAIEQAIKDATGKDVEIEEPWGDMFRLDVSALSGTSRFYDGTNTGFHLIRPVSRTSIDWDDVLAVIERNRAAGVLVLPPEVRISSLVDATIDGTVWSGTTNTEGDLVRTWPEGRLSYMTLSEEEVTRNYTTAITNLSTMLTWGEMGNWNPLPWGTTWLELEQLYDAADALYQYSNYQLPEDLS